MTVTEILSTLEADKSFKKWKETNPKQFLAHVFYMLEGDKVQSFDVGFFSNNNDKMSSFSLKADFSEVSFAGESEVFKKPDGKVLELEPEKVKVEGTEALAKAKTVQEEKYPRDKPFKKIVLLQHLDEGQVWNITYVTQTFKTLNIKVDSASGEIVDDKIVDLIQMGK